MVAGSIRFSYFHELFGRLNLGPDDTITVLRRDRTIIMRRPFDLDIIGKNLADRANLEPGEHEVDGSYAGAGSGRSDAAAVGPARQHRSALRRGRKAAATAS